MRWTSNNRQRGKPRVARTNHSFLNPEPFPCQCGSLPEVEKATHPDSGKPGYYVVRCQCGNESIHAKQLYKAVLDWNIKPISQAPARLSCPGLPLDDLSLHDVLEVVREAQERLGMILNDKERPQLPPDQWHLLKAKHSWYQMLITVAKRRLKALENTQPILNYG